MEPIESFDIHKALPEESHMVLMNNTLEIIVAMTQ